MKPKNADSDDLDTCGACGWRYEAWILSQMFHAADGQSGYTKPMCGICAETIIGHELHGQAGLNRDLAERWRQDHPELKPAGIAPAAAPSQEP